MSDENRFRATAIIPAYNEADHIERVLRPLHGVPQLRQIIVVDDGSVDDTAGVVSAYRERDSRVRLVRLAQNQGKGNAIMSGIRASNNDLLVLLDADLLHLRSEHVLSLLRPVQQRRCAMTLGVFRNGRRQTNLSHRLFYFLSGQRCLRWSDFRHAAAFRDAQWGIEIALNLVARRRNLPVQRVPWEGVSHTMRLEKMSGLSKYWTYVEMWGDIFRFAALYGLRQMIKDSPPAKRIRQFAHRQITLSD